MQLRKGNKYKELSEEYDDSQFFDANKETTIPWKGIAFAVALVFIGSFFVIHSYSMYSSQRLDYSSFLPLFIMGWLAFIPGIYHVWIAIQAYQKVRGYSFDDIPNFD